MREDMSPNSFKRILLLSPSHLYPVNQRIKSEYIVGIFVMGASPVKPGARSIKSAKNENNMSKDQ